MPQRTIPSRQIPSSSPIAKTPAKEVGVLMFASCLEDPIRWVMGEDIALSNPRDGFPLA